MAPDFTSLYYLALIAVGAVIGIIIGTILWAMAFFWPALAGWVIAPPIVGVVGGFLYAWKTDK